MRGISTTTTMGSPDVNDTDPTDPNRCSDLDMDGCDDCASGQYDPNNDGSDADGNGICDASANVIAKSVGAASGRDFPTISAWIDARHGDLGSRTSLLISRSPSTTSVFEPGELITGPGCVGTYVAENATSKPTLRMTLDGYTGTCNQGDVLVGFNSNAQAIFESVITTGVIERAILYDDATFTENVVIEGSTTDPQHYMHITVAPESRHDGTAGTGVVINPPGTGHGIQILDKYTIVEWVEITDWTDDTPNPSHDGINIQATGVLVQNVIVHDDGHDASGIPENDSDANGIIIELNDISATVRNSIVYNLARHGIGIHDAQRATLTVENCTVLRCVQLDDNPGNYGCVGSTKVNTGGSRVHVYNTIAMMSGNGAQGDFAIGGGSWGDNSIGNMSSDDSVLGVEQMTTLYNLLPSDQFVRWVSIGAEQEDLHLKSTSAAIGNGANLSSRFRLDIDHNLRPGKTAWDIGADEHP